MTPEEEQEAENIVHQLATEEGWPRGFFVHAMPGSLDVRVSSFHNESDKDVRVYVHEGKKSTVWWSMTLKAGDSRMLQRPLDLDAEIRVSVLDNDSLV